MPKVIGLTPKEELFCQHYIVDLNATQAAKNAGYSKRSAGTQGTRLLKKGRVASRVQELMDGRSKGAKVEAKWVLDELLKIAKGRMSDVATWNESGVRFKPSDEIEEDAMASISEVSETVNEYGGALKLKQYDRVRALELLGKHMRLFTDKVEHSADESFATLVVASMGQKPGG